MSGMTDSADKPAGPGARDFLRRRLVELAGLAAVAAALLLLAALASYHPGDPSGSRATDDLPLNWLGRPGAIAADVALQSLGLACLALAAVLLAWGWQLLRHGRLRRWWLRITLLPLALTAAAMALAALPAPETWPAGLRTGLGGFLGGWLVDRQLTRLLAPDPATIGLLSAGVAAVAWFFAAGIPWQAYRALAGRAIAVLGRAGLGGRRAYGSLGGSGQPAPLAAPEGRLEPRLGPPEDAIAPPPSPSPGRRQGLLEERQRRPKPGKRAAAGGQTTLDLVPGERYALPPLDLLAKPAAHPTRERISDEALEKNARLLEKVLEDFGVKGQIVKVRPGPVVTLYELEPAPGTKTSRVVGLADDIARSMSALAVRVAVVPGRSVIGIELPNRSREMVYLSELLASAEYERTAAALALVLGKDIGGQPVIVDLAAMPHLLVAGTTGSGKSVALNTMILSLVYRLAPDRCKFIMIDPKMLELSVYEGIPHLLHPVVTDPRKAIVALKWTVREMEDRYRAMSRLGVRNIDGYNRRIAQALEAGETLTRRVQTGFDPDTGEPIYEDQPFELEPLALMVVVVDEMADLMIVAGKDIEAAIQRLSQMARAAGIHLIMATQRPSVDVITGTIKANFPTRISFHVTSRIDSRTILGETGAEQLLGQGDMLYMAQGGRITRVHGPFVTDREVEAVVAFLKRQGAPTYLAEVTRDPEEEEAADDVASDALYQEALALVRREGKASTSFVQRHLQIGYNRAARIVERMEKDGVVSQANHAGKREILIS